MGKSEYSPNYEIINQQAFFGGTSFDKKIGIENSLQYLRGFDWRKNPSSLVQGMQARGIDNGALDGLPLNIEQAVTGERFLITDIGSLWLIKSDNTLLRIGDIGEPAGGGLLYRTDNDTLYISGQKSIHTYGFIKDASNRKLTRNFLAASKSTNTKGSYPSIRSGGNNTYTLPTTSTINEENTKAKMLFTSDISPLETIRFKVVAPGTGDVTILVHDPLNQVIATKTLTTAELNAAFLINSKVSWTFTPIDILVKPNARQYHVHIYASTGTTTIQVATADDLSTADFEIDASRMVTTRNGFHPIEQFLQYIAVGNGRYLSFYEPLTDGNADNTEYLRHRLVLPDGYEMNSMAKTDEFLLMAFEKVSTDTNRVANEGLLVFFDGLSGNYNFFIELTEGAPQAAFTKGNIPHIMVGGTLFMHLGGKELTRVRDMPKIDTDFQTTKDVTRMYPYSMASFKKMMHVGFPGITQDPTLEFGVYSYGSVMPEFASSFGFSYMLSHGLINTDNGANALKIGTVRGFGAEMYIGWQLGTKYGLDIVDSNCAVAKNFKATVRQFDARNIHKLKEARSIVVSCDPVPANTRFTITYTIDNGTEVVKTTTLAAGKTQLVEPINERFHQIDYGVVGTSDDGVIIPVRINGIALEWDPLPDEGTTDATG